MNYVFGIAAIKQVPVNSAHQFLVVIKSQPCSYSPVKSNVDAVLLLVFFGFAACDMLFI